MLADATDVHELPLLHAVSSEACEFETVSLLQTSQVLARTTRSSHVSRRSRKEAHQRELQLMAAQQAAFEAVAVAAPSLMQLTGGLTVVGLFLALLCWRNGPTMTNKDMLAANQDLLPGVSDSQSSKTKGDQEPRASPIAKKAPAPSAARGVGICCCSDGIKKLLKRPARTSAREISGSNPDFEAVETSPAIDTQQKHRRAPSSCIKDGHPDFSGTWKCVKAEGALDELFADIGLGVSERTAIAAYGWGAGSVTRVYKHAGTHIQLTESALEDTFQEWHIDGTEQVIALKEPFLQTAHWDEEEDHVLVLEGKDVEKKKPQTWTISRQYFLDEDSFVIETTGSGGHRACWTYQRV